MIILTLLLIWCIAALAIDIAIWFAISRAFASGSSQELEGERRDVS